MNAIETHYKGYRFRSRLEARWAVFFDAIGVRWLYEHEGVILPDGSKYLPDFFLPEFGYHIEVKPGFPIEESLRLEMAACVLGNNLFVTDVGCPGDEGLHSGSQFIQIVADLDVYEKFGFHDDPETVGWSFCDWGIRCPKFSDYCGNRGLRIKFDLWERVSEPDWVRRAYDLARGARFEHGESPAPRCLRPRNLDRIVAQKQAEWERSTAEHLEARGAILT